MELLPVQEDGAALGRPRQVLQLDWPLHGGSIGGCAPRPDGGRRPAQQGERRGRGVLGRKEEEDEGEQGDGAQHGGWAMPRLWRCMLCCGARGGERIDRAVDVLTAASLTDDQREGGANQCIGLNIENHMWRKV